MGINIGTEGIGEVFVGTESIGRVYAGTELVWQKAAAAPYAFTGTGDGGLTAYSTAPSLFYGPAPGVAATRTISFTNGEGLDFPDTGLDDAGILAINSATATIGANTVIISDLTGFQGIRRTYSNNLFNAGTEITYNFIFDTDANATASIATISGVFGAGFAFGNVTIVIT